jgi:hypothetical protein
LSLKKTPRGERRRILQKGGLFPAILPPLISGIDRLLDSNPMMQHFQNKQDQSWKQPTEDSVETSISKKLKATLNNPDVPDDVKAKRYSHNLNRFLQTKSKVPLLTIEDLLDLKEEPTVDELLDLKRTGTKRGDAVT